MTELAIDPPRTAKAPIPLDAPTATIGRVVHVILRGEAVKHNNNTDRAPAMIVRAWTNTVVNVKVFTDGLSDMWLTALYLFRNEDDALAYHMAHGVNVAYWPAR